MSDEGSGSPQDARIGTQVAGYRLDSLIGVGGMGLVYGATAPDGTSVAIKLVKREFAGDETFQRRFQREVRIARDIHHPHVVPVLDSGVHDGLPYLVARYVEGGSLEDMLRRESRLDVPTTTKICSEVSDGLEALWAAGMVHRDIKPGNILFDGDGVALITDFGLAKDSKGTNLTRAGQTLGSMDYMAPEQIRGEEVNAATDIYALACVMFECIDGRPPFADRPGMRVLWAHLSDEPGDPGAERDDIPAGFTDALKRGLSKSPEDRPPSATEYARGLAEAAASSS
jgi:serine/threonine protein kinase